MGLNFLNIANLASRRFYSNEDTAFVQKESSIDGKCETEYIVKPSIAKTFNITKKIDFGSCEISTTSFFNHLHENQFTFCKSRVAEIETEFYGNHKNFTFEKSFYKSSCTSDDGNGGDVAASTIIKMLLFNSDKKIDQQLDKAEKSGTVFEEAEKFETLLLSNETSDFVSSDQLNAPFPDIDWRRDGYVSTVKDQAPCYSCWAFPAVGIAEFWHWKKTKEEQIFSEQNLIDCGKGKKYQLGGCKQTTKGGNIEYALNAIKGNGIYRLEDYPWIGKDQGCKKLGPSTQLYLKNARFTPSTTPTTTVIIERLRKGLVAAGVYVDPDKETISPWDTFKGKGILKVPCSSKIPNHAILIVGSGREKGQNYFIIKNSWGVQFGDNGFARLLIERHFDSCIANYVYVI